MRARLAGLVASLAFFSIVPSASAAPPAKFAAFLQRHCADCHDASTKEGGLDLGSLAGDLSDAGAFAKWERIHDRVRAGEMPPSDAGSPPAAAKAAFLKSLAADLTAGHVKSRGTVLRRLNRREYERTLNELLGVRVNVADMLPEDGKSHGFDNVGEALDLSPVQMQRYLEAAGIALDAAANFGPRPESATQELRFDTGRNEKNVGEHWLKRDDGAVVFFSAGGFPAIKVHEFRAKSTGRHRFRVHAATHNSERPITYAVHFGKDTLEDPPAFHSFHEAFPGDPRVEEFDAELRKDHTLRIWVHGLEPSPKKEDKFKGAGLAILKIEVEGPIVDEWPGRGHRLRFGELPVEDKGPTNQRDKSWYKPQWRLVSADPKADARRVLPKFVEAAFRRPVDAATIEPFVALAEEELGRGATLEAALRTAQIAVLCSPDFLYLIEPPGKLDDHALAARLSYALWGSPPDETLLALAAKKRLSDPQTLREQTERLLADPRASWFTESFIGQWLNLREIDFTIPDKQLYPEFDDSLKQAMLDETRLFFDEVLHENLRVTSFVDSDWTFLNERLARHYGIEGVAGVAMRKTTLKPEHHRGGVLTHASVLKVSANGTTTSPVVRGAYVLERILGVHPSPPPPGVPGVEPDIRGATTLREQLEKHRNDQTCNSCHRVIDPPGFALENYDVMGGWRENYRSLGNNFPAPKPEQTGGKRVRWRVGPPVDASGETPDGEKFAGLADYKRLLLAEPTIFARAMAEKLATYATGRGMGFSDRPALDAIAASAVKPGRGFRDLVHEIVQSDLFRTK